MLTSNYIIFCDLGFIPVLKEINVILFSAKKCNPVEITRDAMNDMPIRAPNKGLVFDESIQV